MMKPKPMATRNENRCRLFIGPGLIDENTTVPDHDVLVDLETLDRLCTLPRAEAAKIFGQIIVVVAHYGAIKPSVTEKKLVSAHKRVVKFEENPPHHDDPDARQYRRDRKTLGLDPRPPGRRSKTGQKRR
jgi:hypothetical protein